MIAPALGGFIAHHYGFAMIFVISSALAIVALLLSLFLPSDPDSRGELKDDDHEISLKQFFLIFEDPRLSPVYAVILVNMFLVGIMFGFLPFYLHSIGYTPLQSGTAVSAVTLSYLLVQPLAGYLADTFSTRITVLAGLVVAALATIAVVF